VPQVAAALARIDGAAQVAVREVADRYGVSQQAIAAALVRLAMVSVTDVCSWSTVVGEDGKPRQVLEVFDSARLSPDVAYGIVKVRQSKDGSIEVELADKRQALLNLAQVMGLVTDKGASAVDPVTGKPVDRFQPVVLQIVRK
jgi:hypothetical protein